MNRAYKLLILSLALFSLIQPILAQDSTNPPVTPGYRCVTCQVGICNRQATFPISTDQQQSDTEFCTNLDQGLQGFVSLGKDEQCRAQFSQMLCGDVIRYNGQFCDGTIGQNYYQGEVIYSDNCEAFYNCLDPNTVAVLRAQDICKSRGTAGPTTGPTTGPTNPPTGAATQGPNPTQNPNPTQTPVVIRGAGSRVDITALLFALPIIALLLL